MSPGVRLGYQSEWLPIIPLWRAPTNVGQPRTPYTAQNCHCPRTPYTTPSNPQPVHRTQPRIAIGPYTVHAPGIPRNFLSHHRRIA